MGFAKLKKQLEDAKKIDAPKTAILWGAEDLLAQAVSLFLEVRTTWNVIKVSSDESVEYLIDEVKRLNPDVVILCQEKVDAGWSLPVRLIQEQLCLKVITVELESNLMQVYSKHNVILQRASDLLSIVETGYF